MTSASPGAPSLVTIRAALLDGGRVRIAGTVTIPATLLDSTGRRIVVQDRTGAVEVLLPTDSAAPQPGERIEVTGTLGTAYGAPRIAASEVTVTGAGAAIAPCRASPK